MKFWDDVVFVGIGLLLVVGICWISSVVLHAALGPPVDWTNWTDCGIFVYNNVSYQGKCVGDHIMNLTELTTTSTLDEWKDDLNFNFCLSLCVKEAGDNKTVYMHCSNHCSRHFLNITLYPGA